MFGFKSAPKTREVIGHNYSLTDGMFLKDGKEVKLGSQDLLMFAEYAREHGFVLMGFRLGDGYLEPLGDDENMSVSSDLVSMMNEYGLSEAETALRREYDGFYVLGVNMRSQATGSIATVLRRGQVWAQDTSEVFNVLRGAFEQMELS